MDEQWVRRYFLTSASYHELAQLYVRWMVDENLDPDSPQGADLMNEVYNRNITLADLEDYL